MSNDNETTWEQVTNGNIHQFSSLGKNISVIFEHNTSNQSVAPIVFSYSVIITPAALSGMNIVVGDNNENNMDIDFELNSTSTPISYNGTDSSLNSYINTSRDDINC